MVLHGSDSLVWLPDEERAYIGCRVKTAFQSGQDGGLVEVLEEEGKMVPINAKVSELVLAMDEGFLDMTRGYEDMVHLKELNEASILHNLRFRFDLDEVYTNVGTILVAVNPFKQLPIYTPEVLDRYRTVGSRNCPPHVFGVADRAYHSLVSMQQDQSCIISGESGSGKTETTKLFLQYITEVSSSNNTNKKTTSEGSGGLQEQILQANPLMEAFGNAKTVRNNNSSRFGKWISIKFDSQTATMVGGSITSYLLEKSRIVHQSEGERNYHVFYQLCAGARADKKLRDGLGLGEAEEYHYLNQSKKVTVEGVNDETEFIRLKHAMTVMKLSEGEQIACLEVLAGILHLGNLATGEREVDGDGQAFIRNPHVLATCSKLFSVEQPTLERVLTMKKVGVRSIIYKPYNATEAKAARDALAKAIYGNLFEWLIQKINFCLGEKKSDADPVASKKESIIGVLDIFGFESFQINSFEQLCINYCNEKLQLHFNQHIFQLEQEEYRAEGIDVNRITFTDNEPCVQVLENKGTGIFSMIDEEINIPRGTDSGFLSKVLQNTNEYVLRPSMKATNGECCFVIAHYAGMVTYNVTGFLEKNKDLLHDDLSSAMKTSKSELVRLLFHGKEPTNSMSMKSTDSRESLGGSSLPRKQKTLSSKFKGQLSTLMEILNQTQPHFIRCIKPNAEKAGDLFVSPMVLMQLRCAGLLQVCEIRRVGYPVRLTFEAFLKRYRHLAPSLPSSFEEFRNSLPSGILDENSYQIGHSKVFMRHEQQVTLEIERENALRTSAIVIQSFFRTIVCRLRYVEFLRLLTEVREANTIEELRRTLSECVDIPNQNVPAIVAAKAKLVNLEEQAMVMTLLRDALGSLDVTSLNAALEAAQKVGLEDSNCSEVKEARDALARVEAARQLRLNLEEAIANRSLEQLTILLDTATNELGLTGDQDDVVRHAQKLKARLQGEEELMEELSSLLKGSSEFELFETCLNKISDWGITGSNEDIVKEAQDICNSLSMVQEAMRNRDTTKLATALGNLPESNQPECAKTMLSDLQKEESLRVVVKEFSDVAAIRAARNELTDGCDLDGELRASADKAIQKLELIAVIKGTKDSKELEALVAKATKLGITREMIPEAYVSLEQAGEASKQLSALNGYVSSRNLTGLQKLQEETTDPEMKKQVDRAVDQLTLDNKLIEALAVCCTAAQVEAVCSASESTMAPQIETMAYHIEQKIGAVSTNDTSSLEQLKEKALANHLQAMMPRIVTAIAMTQTRKELESELETCLDQEPPNLDRIREILAELGKMEYSSSLITKARGVLERHERSQALLRKLDEAIEREDLDELNEAQASLLDGGAQLPHEKQSEIRALTKKLMAQRDDCSQILSEVKILKGKSMGSKGIKEADMVPLENTLNNYEKDRDTCDYKKSETFLETMKAQLATQETLEEALASGEVLFLKSALEAAQEIDLEHLDVFKLVKTAITEKEAEKRRKESTVNGPPPPRPPRKTKPPNEEGDIDAANVERRNLARNVRYDFTRYHKIRSDESFAKGVLFIHKGKTKKDKFIYQSYPINKSVTDLGSEKELNRKAIQIHKNILGYCGDKSMSFPSTLARDLLTKVIETEEMVDEAYVLICKHLTHNPRPESVGRAWQLMCLAVGSVAPTPDFELYLFNFLLRNLDVPGLVGAYAAYAIRRLEGILETGTSGVIPTVEEIEAYSYRPPMLACIELVNGTILTEELPISPDLDVQKVNEICAHFLGLEDPRSECFGISLDGQIPLRGTDFLGDAFARSMKHGLDTRFVFKRTFVMKMQGKDDPSRTDQMYNRLVYLQANSEFMEGRFKRELSQNEIDTLVGIALAIDYGDELPGGLDWKEYMYPEGLETMVKDNILDIYQTHAATDPDVLQNQYVQILHMLPSYGRIYFRMEDQNMTLGIDSSGVHITKGDTEETEDYPFQNLYRWGGNETQFTLVCWTQEKPDQKNEISFQTNLGNYIGGVLLEHVNQIMGINQ